VSIVDLLSRAGGAGRASILMLSLAALLHFGTPFVKEAGQQSAANLTAYRQPDVAKEVSGLREELVNTNKALVDAIEKATKAAKDAERYRDSAEALVSEASRRTEGNLDNYRVALGAAFDQIEVVASVTCLLDPPLSLPETVYPCGLHKTNPPKRTGGYPVLASFPQRPDGYARTR
jgi:hypothetical protein